MMINKQDILNFVSNNILGLPESSQLFSFSQKIEAIEFYALTKKLLSINNFSFYWSDPNESHSFLAYGEVYSISQSNFADLSKLDKQIKNLPFQIISNDNYTTGQTNPLFVGGIKFPSEKREKIWSDFKFAYWSIPQILLAKNGNDFKIVVNTFKDDIERVFSVLEQFESVIPLDDESQIKVISIKPNVEITEWSNSIELALGKISQKKLQKVVLSRFKKIELSSTPNIRQQLEKLEINFDNCVTFAYKSKDSIFFGATPEKLFSVKDGFLEADALAGSIQRGIDEAEDKVFQKVLLEDEKNLAEHKSVVDFILTQLTPFTEKILFDSQPSIKKYSNIHHLYSQIRAKLKNDTSLFALLENLYPTPAVCGFPSSEALSAINELEIFDRGLFAGVIGWFNLHGNAEFFVGIRSALLQKNLLQAYAGCGIVNGSNPISEFTETELKLKPILNLFYNETVYKS